MGIFLSLFLLGNTLSKVSYAQGLSQVNDVDKLFNIAAKEHKQELYDLRGYRGAPLIYLPDVSVESIAEVLAVRVGRDEGFVQEATYQEGTAVLFYSYNPGELQIWLVDKQGIRGYHKRNILKVQLNQAINRLRSSLGVESLQVTRTPHQRISRSSIRVVPRTSQTQVTLDQAIFDLTNILTPETIASSLTNTKHLIIVPVLGLSSVPYAVLKPFGRDSFIVDKMSVSVAASLFDIGAYVSPWSARDAFSSPLIVGNPLLPENDEWVIPPLPAAEIEAQAVAEVMNSNPLISAEATKEEVLSRIEKSSLLYFATHGVANTQNPLEGGFLMFSAQTLKQGWWTAREIQNTRLFAEIAVLSACQTGLGRIHDAGIIGVARAFQIAGVQRVVMSLWNVDDEATSVLMLSFIKHLENNIPSEALRQAMLEARETYPDPSDWASFVLFGTPR